MGVTLDRALDVACGAYTVEAQPVLEVRAILGSLSGRRQFLVGDAFDGRAEGVDELAAAYFARPQRRVVLYDKTVRRGSIRAQRRR